MLEMTPNPLAPPEPGESLTIHPAIEWIRMPLPIRLNHVNVWALRDGEGRDQEKQAGDSWCLIDTGFNNTQTPSGLGSAFGKILKNRAGASGDCHPLSPRSLRLEWPSGRAHRRKIPYAGSRISDQFSAAQYSLRY